MGPPARTRTDAYVEGRRSESGAPFSTMVSDLLRKERAAEEQERLDQALTLDAEAHVAFARATASTSSRIVGSAEAAAPEP